MTHWDEDAEQRVLGAMLQNRQAVSDAMDVLEPDGVRKFYRDSDRAVYTACCQLWAAGETPDPVSVGSIVGDDERLRLVALAASVFSTSNVGVAARKVREAWARREVHAAAERLISETGDPLVAVDRELRGLGDLLGGKKQIVPVGVLAEDLFRRLQDPSDIPPGVPAPLSSMPKFRKGRVYVYGGYTGHGKTILAAQITRKACESGASVTFHALEMTADDMVKRLVSTFGVPYLMLDDERVRNDKWPMVTDAMAAVSSWPLVVEDDPNVTVQDVQRLQRVTKADVVVFDHLHRMRLNGKPGDRRHLLEDACRDFVNLAKTEDCAVVLLAQLSRPGEHERKPVLSDLRETAVIEQEAGVVGFVWRKRGEDGELGTEGELLIEKNRFGRSGVGFRVSFDPSVMMFRQPGP